MARTTPPGPAAAGQTPPQGTRGTLILAGGGTAGHVNPMLATASELQQRGWEVICLGTAAGLEAQLVPAAGFELVTIPRLPLPRRPHPDLVRLPGRLAATVKSLRTVIAQRQVAAAVGFGGYVSAPLYLASRTKVPLAIHEQNARPGVANRLGARWAEVVATTFSGTALRSRRGQTAHTGLPLRAPIAALAAASATQREGERAAALRSFGLDPARFTVLITGGSLGAASLNAMAINLARMLPDDVQVIHLTGRDKDRGVSREITREGYVVIDYLAEMERALAAADVVICRAGAGTVAEISALGLPALYVPLPIGNGEQRFNATPVVTAGGARMIADRDLHAEAVNDFIAEVRDPRVHTRMGAQARAQAPADASQKLADLIEGMCHG